MTDREPGESPRGHAKTARERLELNANGEVPWKDGRLLKIEWLSVLAGVGAGAVVEQVWSWRELKTAATTLPGGAWLALAFSVVYAIDRWSAELTGADSDIFGVVSRGVKLALPMFAVGVTLMAALTDLLSLDEPLGYGGALVLVTLGLFALYGLSRAIQRTPRRRR